MNELAAIIQMVPVPWARSGMTVREGHAAAYLTPETREAEKEIRFAIRDKVVNEGPFLPGIPLCLWAVFYTVKPKSWKKSDNEPFKRPDVDNYGKLLLDALNDYAIPDDSQVIHLDVWKLFSSQPHIEFRVWKYEA